MFTRKSIFRTLSILLAVLLLSGTASASPLNAALGTGFTYQGKLTDGGAPADGDYDFEFKLYNALSGGSQVGSTVPLGNVVVTGGLFTVQLDFGNVFNGTALFLEIGVRPGASTGAYTALTPRQALTATPFAIYAAKAPWSGLSGVPAGFADGVDNGSAYQNVKVVAQSGGDFTTITAALASITTASTTNRYLIYVAPGVYTESVTMKQYVDIEGAGELTTKITYTGSASFTTGTVVGANNAELRFLTVENTGGADSATAIYNSSTSPRLTHVTANASGGTNNFGVYNNSSSSPTMMNVTVNASGGTVNNYGVNNNSSSPTMTNVTINASGGTYNYGVFNESSSPTMTNVSVSASAPGGAFSFGVYNARSSPTINNSVISASDGTGNYGIVNVAGSGSYTVLVNNSQISGSSNTIYNDAEFTTRVGASQLSGGAVTLGGGTVTCAGVYDENYAFTAGPACP